MEVPYPILVIDDSAHVRILLMRLLKQLGATQIDSAENGLQGIEKFKTSPAAIIFLDGIMPEMDGLAVLREVKKLRPETIVVMTTSLSEREKVLQFKDSGADYYILKPFEDKKVEEILGKALGVLENRKS
jgi:two-component system chemotaxis response regulator CheY